MTNEYSEYLAHHGIKGMKWGVRRFQDKDGKRIKGSKPESQTWKAKDAPKLSNEELDRRNQRLQKENNYRTNVENAHPAKKEMKQALKKILLYSAIGVSSAFMAKHYQAGLGFIKNVLTYKLPLDRVPKVDLDDLRSHLSSIKG